MKTKDFLAAEEEEVGQSARLDAHPPTSDRGRPPLDRRAAHHFPALSSGRWKPLEEKWRVQLLPLLLLLMMSLMLMSEPPQRKRKRKEHRAQPSSTAPADQPEKSALVVHW